VTKPVVRERPANRYQVGAGVAIDLSRIRTAEQLRVGAGSILDAMQQSSQTPVWNMDVIEQVRWTMTGPQVDESITVNFGAEIDLFGSGKSPFGIDYVETTMAQTGQTQVNFVACYVGFHIEPEPLCWTVIGNAVDHPTQGGQKPPSPDVFTRNDYFNGALFDPNGPNVGMSFVPAILRWGWWANYVGWHLARAYNYRWKIGQHVNIMDEQLRHTAYMPPNAQEGSASNSQVDTVTFVSNVNKRYDALGSALNFMPVDFVRSGSTSSIQNPLAAPPTDANPTVNLGVFNPNRHFELVPATYGGMDLRSMLRGNSEFRKMCVPYVIPRGVPIGIFLQETDSVQGDQMRQFLSITQGLGGQTPPAITPDLNWNADFTWTNDPNLTSVNTVMLEATMEASTYAAQQVDAQRVIFQGGDLKLTLPIRGFEVSQDWYTQLSSNADLRDAIFACVGIKFAL